MTSLKTIFFLLLPRIQCCREPGAGALAPGALGAPARAASDSAHYTLRSDIFNTLITLEPLLRRVRFRLGPGVANIAS
jgi:hypothetical protein